MKLNLRKVMAFGAAALIGLGASAQTLTTVWEQALGGTPASSDCRFGMGMNGKVYAVNKATNTLLSWDATGVSEVATNADVFTGTGITRDDAGNILVNKGFPNATSTTDWTIIPADGSDYISLSLVMPDGVEASRTDCVGRVVGDVMSADGGYIFITTNKGNAVAMVKIVEGAQDESNTLASPVWSDDTFDATTLAQPAYSTVEDIEGAADPSTACYWRKRGNIAIYGWNLENGTDEIKNPQPVTDGTNTARSSDGFDVFTLDGVVYGITSFGTLNYCDGLAVHNLATGEVVATSETKYTAGSLAYQGIFTEVVDENTVNIYQYVSGQYARQLQFTLATEEPAAPLYMVGHNNEWDPANPTEIPATETAGVYSLSAVEFTNPDKAFKISENKGTWDEFNAKAMCADGDAVVQINTPTKLYLYAGTDITYAENGTYDVTVDLSGEVKTITLKKTVGVEDIEAVETVAPVYYNLQGVEIANPSNGLYIVKRGNKVAKEVVVK